MKCKRLKFLSADKTKAIKRQVEAPPATRQTMGTQQAQSKEGGF